MTGRGVVLRAGELFLKGKNRATFEQALVRRVREALRPFAGLEVWTGQGRIYVRGGEPAGLVEALADVFGASSLSPVVFVARDLEAIAATCAAMADEARARGARTFRITAKRADKRFDLSSPQINVAIGGRVQAATGLEVDLGDPDVEIGVEIGTTGDFVYDRVVPAAGGLPVGVSGSAVLLLSGGIDSPVAGHLAQKRGLSLSAVHFHSAPWTSAASKEKARRLAGRLARRQAGLDLHTVPFGRAQDRIREHVEPSYRVILYRRLMLRISEALARRLGAGALVTGDSLGQVASQTLENLACISAATEMLVLRPLVGLDKAEVIEMARRLGTYDVSILPHDDCCSLFVPKHPETRGRPGRAASLEEPLGLGELVADALAEAEVERLDGVV